MADRYTIDINKYIPPNLRPFAQGMGLDDLSNLNPFTSLFSRPRDAAARYAEPEKYSPTGKRETMDLVEAAMGPAEALAAGVFGKYLMQPAKQILTSTFTGVDPDLSQADAPSPVGIETLVPPPENLAQNEVFDMPSSLELDFLRSMGDQVEEGEVPFAPLDSEPYVPNFDDQFTERVDTIDMEDPELFGFEQQIDPPAPANADDFELPDYDDVFVPDNTPTIDLEMVENPNYREYGINFDNDLAEDVGIDIERGLIFTQADGPQSIFERTNYDDLIQRFGTGDTGLRDDIMTSLTEGSFDLLDTYMDPVNANRVRLGILSDIGMPAADLDEVDQFMGEYTVQTVIDPVTGETIFDGVDPSKSYQYGLMDSDTPFKSKYAEVVQGLNQTKFGSAADFLNLLRNKGVTEAELQARDLTEKVLPAGKFDAKSLTGLDEKSPLKVTIHTGPNTSYGDNFTSGGDKYSETVITLDTPNPDVGLAADRMHFTSTQSSAGGPTVVHLRTAYFDVAGNDPKSNYVPKAYHLGEIQSQATQDARLFRKKRNRIEEDLGGPQKLSDFAYGIAMPEDRFGRGKTLLDAMTEYKDTEILVKNIKSNPNATDSYAAGGVRLADHERHLINLRADIEKVLESGNSAGDPYDFKTFDEALEYQNKVQNFLLEDQGIFARSQTRSQINESLSQIYGPDTVDDLGIGSLYTTDRTTTIALKQALDEAVNADVDFLTIGTGDMAFDMTGGTLEGQQEYYDEIVPKTLNKLLVKLEKENKVKLPRLKTKTIQGTDGGTHVVRGLELTDELKKIFNESGVYAFKKGGEVGLRSGVMSAPGNGMVR